MDRPETVRPEIWDGLNDTQREFVIYHEAMHTALQKRESKMNNVQTKRAQAIKLLRRYEKLKAELRMLEPELNKACVEYGLAKASPMWGFRKELLKIELEMEAERKGRKVA